MSNTPAPPPPSGQPLPPVPSLACPLCGNQQFQQEQARSDSRWGFTSHRMTLMVCLRCRYVLHFYDRHSIFDFD